MALNASLLISGDASAAQKAVENVKQGLTQLGASAGQVQQNLKQLEAAERAKAASSKAMAQMQAEAGSAMRDMAGAAGAAGAALGSISAGANNAAGAVENATKKLREHEKASNDNEAAAKRHAMGMRNMGQQAGDMAVMIQGGIDPMRAFATQAGQMGYALSEMGGKAGAVGAFLTGPWGIALTIAVTSLAPFISKLFETEQASDAAKEATADLSKYVGDIGSFFDKATGRIRETNRALVDFAVLSRQQANDKLRGQMVGLAQSGEAARDRSTRNLSPVFAERGLGGDTPAKINFDVDDALKLPLAQANARLLQIARSNSTNAKQASDLLRDRALFARSLQEIEKNNAEIRSLRTGTLQPSLRERGTSGAVGDRTGVLDQEAKLAAATSARERAQAQLALTQARGRAAVDAGTMSEAQYRDAVTAGERAVNAAEAAERGAASSRRDANKQRQEAAKATREAEQAERQLAASLDRLAGRYDPAKAAARGYREELEEISKLVAAGKLTPGEGFDYQMRGRAGAVAAQARSFDQSFRSIIGDDAIAAANSQLEQGVEAAAVAYRNGLVVAGRAGGEALSAAVTSVADLFGVRIGGSLGAFSKTGHQRSNDAGAIVGSMAAKIGAFFSKEGAEALGRNVGDFAGKRLQGASEGQAGAGLAGMVGVKTSGAGGAIGGAIGSFLPIPGGSIIGGLAGGVLGGLFGQKKDYGTATVTGAGVSAGGGNSGAASSAASGLGGQVQDNLAKIAEQLGGQIGSYLVSIGTYDGDYRVSTSGQSGELSFGKSNKSKATLKDFGSDQAGALAYATMDAIADGAITGVSGAVAKALKSSPDLNKALSEALKVQEVETSLKGIAGTYEKAFTDLAAQAKDRVRIAQQYGFDVLAIEKKNGEDRAKLSEQLVKAQAGSLQALVKELTSGSLFEGTAMERIGALEKDIAAAKLDLDAGKDGAADTLANLYAQRLAASEAAYAKTGAYAAYRNTTIAEAQAAIARVNQQVNAAQSKSDPALKTTNDALDENNDQNARLIAQNAAILDAVNLTNSLLQRAGSTTTFDLAALARV